jgi:hypothetical protein
VNKPARLDLPLPAKPTIVITGACAVAFLTWLKYDILCNSVNDAFKFLAND